MYNLTLKIILLRTICNNFLRNILRVCWLKTTSEEELWIKTRGNRTRDKKGMAGTFESKNDVEICKNVLRWSPQEVMEFGRPKETVEEH